MVNLVQRLGIVFWEVFFLVRWDAASISAA
jgi:hypothetical protein